MVTASNRTRRKGLVLGKGSRCEGGWEDGIALRGTWHTAIGAEYALPSPQGVGGSYQISMMPVFFCKASASWATPLAVIWFWISLEEEHVLFIAGTQCRVKPAPFIGVTVTGWWEKRQGREELNPRDF